MSKTTKKPETDRKVAPSKGRSKLQVERFIDEELEDYAHLYVRDERNQRRVEEAV